MTPEQLTMLRGAAGRAALAEAATLAAGDPLAAVERLRRSGHDPRVAAAALGQAGLRRRAAGKFGADAQRMFFTDDGLQQATRPAVAARRADRFVATGGSRVLDLCCGLGSDAVAFARAGLTVTAVDADPGTAAVAAANAEALGLADRIEVRVGDAASAHDAASHDRAARSPTDLGPEPAGTEPAGPEPTETEPTGTEPAETKPTETEPTETKPAGTEPAGPEPTETEPTGAGGGAVGPATGSYDVVFCDPARRAGGRRVFDPAAYSPPWEFLLRLTAEAACLKLGPGIDHALLPAGVEAEWVSVRGDVVEAALWCGPLARVPRRATVLDAPDGTPVAELTGAGDREAPVAPLRRYLYEPDGAVLRAHLVAELADAIDGTLGAPGVGYLYTDRPVTTPFARGYEIEQVLPFSVKRLRAALRARDVGVVTIKKRGIAVEPDALRRALKPAGANATTVFVTRIAGAPTALLAHPLPPPA